MRAPGLDSRGLFFSGWTSEQGSASELSWAEVVIELIDHRGEVLLLPALLLDPGAQALQHPRVPEHTLDRVELGRGGDAVAAVEVGLDGRDQGGQSIGLLGAAAAVDLLEELTSLGMSRVS